MATDLKPKAIDCLKLMAIEPKFSPEWSEHYAKMCAAYSEKAVYRKMAELVDRGYIEYGTTPRAGWLTEKGEEALKNALEI